MTYWNEGWGDVCNLPKTGQESSYHNNDDGYNEFGIAHDYKVMSTGDQSGTTAIVINGKTHNLSNNCVKDRAALRNGKPIVWARYVPLADIGPAADGRLFWKQWTLGPKTDISFDAVSKEIRSAAAEFDTGALCAGRKYTITGSANNNTTFTVVSITTSVCVVSEAVTDEAAGASVSLATVDDLIWDFLDQANANSLGGYSDWEIPNIVEINSLQDYGLAPPTIDSTTFPSTPIGRMWSSTTRRASTLYVYAVVTDGSFPQTVRLKKTQQEYIRLVRS